jgi:hypothetical protein
MGFDTLGVSKAKRGDMIDFDSVVGTFLYTRYGNGLNKAYPVLILGMSRESDGIKPFVEIGDTHIWLDSNWFEVGPSTRFGL